MNASPRGGPAGMREPPRANRRPVPLGRRPWFQAAMAVAALGLVAASVTMLVWRNGPPSRHVASNCGLINCGAAAGPEILAAGLAITAAAGPEILAAGLAITAAVGPAILAAEP
jgi:hypothetical protein